MNDECISCTELSRETKDDPNKNIGNYDCSTTETVNCPDGSSYEIRHPATILCFPKITTIYYTCIDTCDPCASSFDHKESFEWEDCTECKPDPAAGEPPSNIGVCGIRG